MCYYVTLHYVKSYRKLRIAVYCIHVCVVLYLYITMASYLKNYFRLVRGNLKILIP
jgi:hypothetical protein